MAKFLIINGDDFGMSEYVNQGIMEAHTFGPLTSASLMVNMKGFEQAVRWAKLTPTLGVGLHFNLTWGKPISEPGKVASLIIEDGSFSGNRGQWCEEDIELEFQSQYNKMVAAGLPPTHLDSHHHIHIENPRVYSVLKKFANQYGLPLRLNPNTTDILDRPLMTTDHLILDTYDTSNGASRLLSHLIELNHGTTELMCHPGYPEYGLRLDPSKHDSRGREFLALTDHRIPTILREQDIQLIHYGHLTKVHDLQKSPHPSRHSHSPNKTRRLPRTRRLSTTTTTKTRHRTKRAKRHPLRNKRTHK
ncbi:carbohydrate deacetylase [Paenibacillus segetis]|uniref:carbohydrate deacetylase n=1 Tax=Paenibacillus segetis TaxID=1325360 RepID=UPI001665F211|nr:ChbG/HpnK family deacetylase [Paenibacillus segetis]